MQIKHLLSHTSGIGIGEGDVNLTYLNESYKRQFRFIDDYKYLSSNAELRFEPGSRFSYSNIGMHLLGPIIEKMSGENYYHYIQTHIFDPSGMAGAAFYELDRLEPDVATGFVKEIENGKVIWRNNVLACQIKGSPAGGAYATVDDLFKFENALRNHTLVSEKMREILFSAKTDLNASSYGYGFQVREFDGQLRVGHTGGYVGINNLFSMFLNNGFSLIILSNIDLVSGSMVSDIEFFIRSLFF